MLESLHIRNLALVSSLDLDFGPGMNAVTGETGAGKSLIIGAIQLLAGNRAAPGMIRSQEKCCEVTAVIRTEPEKAACWQEVKILLEQNGIQPGEDNCLLLRRLIKENGSRAFVNNTPVTITFLKELGELLIDIHGPNDNQTLLQTNRQLSLLDTYAALMPMLAKCRDSHLEVTKVKQEIKQLQEETLAPEEAELLAYQLKEIEKAEIDPNEETELQANYQVAANAKRLLEIASQCQAGLCDQDGAVTEQMAEFLRLLRELQDIDQRPETQLAEQLESIITNLHELRDDINTYASNLELDEETLQKLEERIDLLQKLKRKYGPGLNQVLETAERIKKRLAAIAGREEKWRELQEREQKAQKKHQENCALLSQQRQKAAQPLAKKIADKLQTLGFDKAGFAIELKPAPPSPNGADAVEFHFAPNVGEAMQPLRAIASSGEISRVMLAVKTVLSHADQVPILIFDEVDANVGGRIAVAVAAELAAVGRAHQVFCITHLPQVAAAANEHFQVSKQVAAGRTSAVMRHLTEAERHAELVRMLGAELDSATASAHAAELLRKGNAPIAARL